MKPKIGLALGSGSARGWAHIGVLRALQEAGITPDILCGCSIGALVGAAYADGDLDQLEHWATGLAWRDVVGLLDVGLAGGLIKGDKLMTFFERHFVDKDFSALPLPFACVATDLANGREIWLREGSVAAAVHASIAMPGLLAPVNHDGRLLVDGGLVNPVPVSLCRALGADIVIAVDLGSDIVGRSLKQAARAAGSGGPGWTDKLLASLGLKHDHDQPSLAAVLSTSINIMQSRIARSRLAGEPADALVAPRLAHLGLMDYHRAAEAIGEGAAAVKRMLPAIEFALHP
ncbi:MAG: patatin-like phospholipase RssA [Gammaproteobacteria bacterium]|nr:patatin-like phospholipase RssA [Rhodocyclaceae bacterium]MBU3909571.1 patatin-like phospholipase RssA [Gammaproteobacteria bacterium]MBU3990746.1 patatin-like phospholipase RssA [Gammaproteobacteria bacterium]MBU4003234.1 patatin-like phospholipase RssA [Gammaproteobacteria bacterium]MBU4022283.1 patatin-like phospholipase RssA [Gammaproteobacteria bacterium]